MKYRKRPVVVEAVQWNGDNHDEIAQFMNMVFEPDPKGGYEEFYIHTMEGKMHASRGDWIIKGVSGEFYPCKPNIFEQTYERVEDDAYDGPIGKPYSDGI